MNAFLAAGHIVVEDGDGGFAESFVGRVFWNRDGVLCWAVNQMAVCASWPQRVVIAEEVRCGWMDRSPVARANTPDQDDYDGGGL